MCLHRYPLVAQPSWVKLPSDKVSCFRFPVRRSAAPMTFLAIETSDPRGSLALFDAEGVREEEFFSEDMAHAREFASRIDGLLRRGNFAPRDLQGISVSSGPGSYTGCRVGVTAAKTLAMALRIPVVSVSSLEVMAASAMESARAEPADGKPPLDAFVPVLDGRRGFFYGALFRRSGGGRPVRAVEDQVAPLAELAGALEGPAWVLGAGADAFLLGLEAADSDEGYRRGPAEWDQPHAATLARLSLEQLAESSFDQERVHSLSPAYLRPSEPEIVLARKLAGENR